MDFLKIIRSIEELLYEAMTWILFYPRTLWRCLIHPDWIIAYTDKELGETPGEQFTDMISPPLFLIISIIIAHGIGLALGARLQASDSESLRAITGNVENLLAFRALFFAIFPLAMAAGLLHTRGQPIDRDTLRSPFYLQCYLAAPFAIMVGTAASPSSDRPMFEKGSGEVLTAARVLALARWLVAASVPPISAAISVQLP